MSCSKMQFFLVDSAKFILRRNGICKIDVQPCLQSPYDPDNYSRLEGFDARRVKNPELCIELFKKFWNRVLLQKLEIHFVPPPPGAPVKKRKKSPYSKARSEGNGGLIGIPNCNVTEALMELFGENVDIEVNITKLKGDDDDDYDHDHNDFYNHYYSNSNSSDDSKEYSIHMRIPLLKGEKYACVDNEFPTDIDPLCNYLEDYYQEYEGERLSHLDSGLEGKISVGVIVKNIDYITFAAEVPHEKMAINKKILQEEVESDLVIIPGTGNPVKGHKIFLAAHSTVFKVMFQPKEGQAEAQTLEMKEMSEESVRALLAYLYYWDQAEANSKPLVACELLNAGRKYEIPALETAMKKLLLSKEDKWFDDVEVAVKFWLFAEDEKQLKTKAMQILKSNFSLAILETSVTFQQLVNENPESPAALKLRKMFL